LKFGGRERANLLSFHGMSREAETSKEICPVVGLRSPRRKVYIICRVLYISESQGGSIREELADLALHDLLRGEGTKVAEDSADPNLLMCFLGDCRGDGPFMLIPLVPRAIEALKKNLSPNHVMGGDARFLQQFTATLYMAEGFYLETNWAIRGVFPAPLVKEGSTGELEAD
jgi:hypothetical protein